MNAITVPRNRKFFWKAIFSGFAVELEKLGAGFKKSYPPPKFRIRDKAVGTLLTHNPTGHFPEADPIALAFTPTADR